MDESVDVFIGLNFRPFFTKCKPVYSVLIYKNGKLHLQSVGILENKEEITAVCKKFNTKVFAFNVHYLEKLGKYKLPKLRLNMYIEELKGFIAYNNRRRKRSFAIYSQSIYGNGNIPSGELLMGLNFRFKKLDKYISDLDINPLKLDWKAHPVDILDAIATSLGLYFYYTGSYKKTHLRDIEVILPTKNEG
ncbi:MAG: hypothetical protein ABIL50_03830 [candidate division WOR-3 bacterium]